MIDKFIYEFSLAADEIKYLIYTLEQLKQNMAAIVSPLFIIGVSLWVVNILYSFTYNKLLLFGLLGITKSHENGITEHL